MLVLCKSASGKDLPGNARVIGENNETQFNPLKIGVEYKVYGVMFYPTRTDMLLCPDGSNPLWVPSNIFEVLDNALPNNWGCVLTEKKDGYSNLYEDFGITAIFSYLQLVRSYQHYIGILEREPDELQKFYEYKLSY